MASIVTNKYLAYTWEMKSGSLIKQNFDTQIFRFQLPPPPPVYGRTGPRGGQ